MWGVAWPSMQWSYRRNPLYRWEETVHCAVPRFSNSGAFSVKMRTFLSKRTVQENKRHIDFRGIVGVFKTHLLWIVDMSWNHLPGCAASHMLRKSSRNAGFFIIHYVLNIIKYTFGYYSTLSTGVHRLSSTKR